MTCHSYLKLVLCLQVYVLCMAVVGIRITNDKNEDARPNKKLMIQYTQEINLFKKTSDGCHVSTLR